MYGTTARLLPAAALVLALALAGCGSDDSGDPDGVAGPAESTSTSAPVAASITREEFIARADQICAAGSDALMSAAADLDEASSQEELDAFGATTLPDLLQTQHDEIAALGVPAGDEAAIGSLLAALQAGIDAARETPDLVFSDDAGLFDEANQIAVTYGLQECGKS